MLNPSNAITELFPYLRVRGASTAIEFYKKVFAAEETMRLVEPGSTRIGHAALKIGPGVVMLSDEYPERGILGPQSVGGTGSMIHLHVENVDAMIRLAVEHGATVTLEPKNQFYGERTAKFRDPFGHEWMLGQHVEDVPADQMQKRWNEMCAKQNDG